MIATIVKKDFLTNLVSPRFIIGFVLCLVLIPFSILINISNFRDRTAQYRLDRDAAEKAMAEVRVYSKLRPEVVLPPEPLSVFGKGVSDQVGNRVGIWIGDKPLLAAGKTAAGDNPFLASFFSVDFVDIAAIVFSLLALIFSYDAFTREKEDGTLKLMMSHSLGRSTALAGKLLGIFVTLLPVLVFSFLLSGILVLLSGDVAFSAGDWGRIALLFAASLLYLAVFVFIGTPRLGQVEELGHEPGRVPLPLGRVRLRRSRHRLQLRRELRRHRLPRQSGPRPEGHRQGARGSDPPGVQGRGHPRRLELLVVLVGRGRSDGGLRQLAVGLREFPPPGHDLRADPDRVRGQDAGPPQQAYLDSLTRQADAAESFSLLSPTGLFRAIASAVCRTDLASHARRMDVIRRYRETFVRWLQGKDAFRSFRWLTPTDPASFKTEDQLTELRTGGEFKTEKDYEAWAAQQKDFRVRWGKLSTVKVKGDSPEDFPFLDISDMPRFEDQPGTLLYGLESSVLKAGFLLVAAVFLFALGYVAFIRYDVR